MLLQTSRGGILVGMKVFGDPLKFIREQGQKLTVDNLLQAFRSRLEWSMRGTDRVADYLTGWFGTITFLVLNAAFFAVWILWNTGYLGFIPFDPFPFNLITTIVSLEAIFLSTVVLISQNRQSRIADLRQRMDFEIDVRAEDEITKILQLLAELHASAGLAKKDKELERMIKKTDLKKIEEEVRNRPT